MLIKDQITLCSTSLIINQPDGEPIVNRWLWSVFYELLSISSMLVAELLDMFHSPDFPDLLHQVNSQ